MTKKTPNHELSEMRCPVSLEDVDLFSPGAQEHWYEAYEILHDGAPVHRIPGEGIGSGSDGFILAKYSDIARVVRDPERFKPTLSVAVEAHHQRMESNRHHPANGERKVSGNGKGYAPRERGCLRSLTHERAIASTCHGVGCNVPLIGQRGCHDQGMERERPCRRA